MLRLHPAWQRPHCLHSQYAVFTFVVTNAEAMLLTPTRRFNKAAPRGRYGGNVSSPEGYLLALWLHECK